MKLQKRSSGEPEESSAPQEQTPASGGKKPVLIYIMILFIVAFVLMAVSFLMHQRSNTEALGQLQSSVSSLKEVQATQDENIRLQKDLQEVQEENEKLSQENSDLTDQLTESETSAQSLQGQLAAMESLYTLQQQYAARDLDACRATIAAMEEAGEDKLLPAELDADDVTSPAQRYLQLREAVQRK